MASGQFRPYSFEDIVGALSDSIDSLSSSSSTSTGTGEFTEADEVVGLIDSASVSTQANPVYGAGQWSAFTWG